MSIEHLTRQAELDLDIFDDTIRRVHPECVTPQIFEEFKAAALALNQTSRELLRWLEKTSRRVDDLERQVNG